MSISCLPSNQVTIQVNFIGSRIKTVLINTGDCTFFLRGRWVSSILYIITKLTFLKIILMLSVHAQKNLISEILKLKKKKSIIFTLF